MPDVAACEASRTARQMVRRVEDALRAAGADTPRAEAEWLVAGSLGVRRTELYLWEHPLAGDALAQVQDRLAQRLQGAPLQHLLGETEFYGARLAVGPGVFIPRPETECLVEAAAAFLQTRADTSPRVLELGTGSGAIAVSLARAAPSCVLVGVELSCDALAVARANVRAHGVAERVWLVQGHWTEAIRGPYDLVISNPPYVKREAARALVASRRGQGDPVLSLDGGEDGMQFHRAILEAVPRLVRPGGAVAMECAEEQADWLARAAWRRPEVASARIIQDLAGRPRAVWLDRVPALT